MVALSLIPLPVSAETSTPTNAETRFSSSIPQHQYDHHQYQNVYQHQPPQYQNQHQYAPSIQQTDYSYARENTVIPHLSPTQSKAMNELVSYQRCWEAIHQRTIKQLEWVKDAEKGLYTSAELQSMLCDSFRAKPMP
uniref:Uncharacterized protein n=1 Tax=Talaromyces marneffei PM1 TaxID=1077442 RepID=A0A093VVH3_TALMA